MSAKGPHFPRREERGTEEARAGSCLVFYSRANQATDPPKHTTESFLFPPSRPSASSPLPPTSNQRLSCDKSTPSERFNDEETLNSYYRKGTRSRVSLRAEDGDATLVEATWILLGGDLKIDREDEVRTGEVQVDGQGHLGERAGPYCHSFGRGRTPRAWWTVALVMGRLASAWPWGPSDELAPGEGGRWLHLITRGCVHGPCQPQDRKGPLTTLAFLSALVCLSQRSCVRGRTVEMAWDSDSLLLLHVAPWSFNPAGRSQALSPVGKAARICDTAPGPGVLPPATSDTDWEPHRHPTWTPTHP